MNELQIEPVKIQIRYADLDALGHVNNSNYLTYFEIARVHYFNELLGKDWDWRNEGMILANSSLEFLKPLLIQHEAEVKISTLSVGTKSFELYYEISVDDVVFCSGKSVIVAFNSVRNETIPIPSVMQEGLLRLQRSK
ncbi:MAG: thioesterase family protein [Crocinitomicaceae bacterium]|jgi:acyl-CoA thioester hydrolase|nr:thioesterase family protein [Crocinitomicaceae bacterium]